MSTIKELWIKVKTDLADSPEKLAELSEKCRFVGDSMKQAGTMMSSAGTGIINSLKGMVNEASNAQSVQTQLNTVLESTHGVAGITADEVLNMASSFQSVTAYGDEAIVSGQNMLLTFTNIGKDVFPMATETMLDMSTALGQDLKGSAIQLGKALQDPVQGVTALRRVGVNFNESQQELIKTMVESGNIMDAQKYILKELQTEFGGSAKAAGETFAGSLERVKNYVGDTKEAIGNALIPMLTNLVQKIQPIIMSTIEWINSNQKLFEVLTLVVAGLGGFLLVGGKIITCLGGMIESLPVVVNGIKGMANSFKALLANPVTLWIAGITAAVIAVIAIFKKWNQTNKEMEERLKAYNQEVLGVKASTQQLTETTKQATEKIPSLWDKVLTGVKSGWQNVAGFIADINNKIFHSKQYDEAREIYNTMTNDMKKRVDELSKAYGGDFVRALNEVADAQIELRRKADEAFEAQKNAEMMYNSMTAEQKKLVKELELKYKDRIKAIQEVANAAGIATQNEAQIAIDAINKANEAAAKAAEERLNKTREIEEKIYKLTHTEMENKIYDLNKERDAYLQAGVDKVKVTAWYNQEIKNINKETLDNSISNINELDGKLKDFSKNVIKDVFIKNWNYAKETIEGIFESISTSFSDNFYKVGEEITKIDKAFRSFAVTGITELIQGITDLGISLMGFSQLEWDKIIKDDLVSFVVFLNLRFNEIKNLFKAINVTVFEGMAELMNKLSKAFQADYDIFENYVSELLSLLTTLQGIGSIKLDFKQLIWSLTDLQLAINILKNFIIDEKTVKDLKNSMKQLNDSFKDFDITNVNKALGDLKSLIEAIQQFPVIKQVSSFVADINTLVLKLGELGKALKTVSTGWKYDEVKKLGDTLTKLDEVMAGFNTENIINGISGIGEIYNALITLPKVDVKSIKANMNLFIDYLFELCDDLKTVESYKIDKLAENLKDTLGRLNEIFKGIETSEIVRFINDFNKLIDTLLPEASKNLGLNTGLLAEGLNRFLNDLRRFVSELKKLLGIGTAGEKSLLKSQFELLAEDLQATLGELNRIFEDVKLDSLLSFLDDWENLNEKITKMKPIDTVKLTSEIIKMVNSLKYLVSSLKQWMYGTEEFTPMGTGIQEGVNNVIGKIIGGKNEFSVKAPLNWIDELEQDLDNTIGRLGQLFSKLGAELKKIFQDWNADMNEVGELRGDFVIMIKESIEELNSLASNPLWEQITLKLTNLKDKVVGTVNEIKTSLTGLKDFYGIVFIQISDKVKIGIDNVIKTLKEKTSELTSSLIALKEAFTISGVNDEIEKFVGNLEKIPEKLNAMIPAIIKFSTIFKDFTFLMVYLLQLMENQVNKLADAINELRDEAYSLVGLVETLTEKILGIFESIKQSEAIREMFGNQNPGSYQNEWEKMKDLYEKIPYIPVPPPPTPPGMPGHKWETEGLEQIIINGDLNISGVQNVEELMNKIKRQSAVRGNVYAS